MRILLAGDTHGAYGCVEVLVKFAKRNACSAIVQCGDFGYWPHTPDGRVFLDRTDKLIRESGLEFYWLDGNHENHDAIEAMEYDGSFWRISPAWPSLRYLPRAERWEWEGVRFGALGGAYSIDVDFRVPGTSWWEHEDLTDDDVERLGDEPLDVLLTHDAPDIPPGVQLMKIKRKHQRASANTRSRIQEAMHATKPKLLVHGHWHYGAKWTQITPMDSGARGMHVHHVLSLASEGQMSTYSNWAVLELGDKYLFVDSGAAQLPTDKVLMIGRK